MPPKKKEKKLANQNNEKNQQLTWNDLIKGVNFRDIFLINSIFQIDYEELLERESKNINVQLNFNTELLKLEETKLITSATIKIDFNYKNQKDEKVITLSNCLVKYILIYGRKDEHRFTDFDTKIITDFIKTNVIFNTWSFAREHISNLLVKSGAPPFYLPSLVI